MKKLLVLVMSLALAAAFAYADDAKWTDNTGEPNNPEGYSRTVDYPCSPSQTPVEDPDHNNSCAHPDPTQLGCEDQIFAWSSVQSHDFYKICINPNTAFVVQLRGCDGSLIDGVRMQLQNNSNCHTSLSDWSQINIEYTNDNDYEKCYKVKVVRDESLEGDRCPDVAYRLSIACTPTNIPCPEGAHNYCVDPIIVPAGLPLVNGYYHYENTVNSCDAVNFIPEIYSGYSPTNSNICGTGALFESGPDIVYEMTLTEETELRIETGIAGGGDTQIMIVTDCNNPESTCILSRDMCDPSCTSPEIIDDLTLQAGTYYIITSKFLDNECNCGDLYIIIDGDHELPVELTGFDAIAGDGEITLNWSTASETNSDYFDIVRDGVTMGRTDAANSVTGHSYAWTDGNLANGREYTYDLIEVSANGTRETVGTISATPAMNEATVTEYALHQNYPNPFNPETNIMFDLVEASDVTLTVFNPLGQTVATLVNGTMNSGRHTVTFDGSHYTSGLYYYRLEAGDFTAIRKMVLMK